MCVCVCVCVCVIAVEYIVFRNRRAYSVLYPVSTESGSKIKNIQVK